MDEEEAAALKIYERKLESARSEVERIEGILRAIRGGNKTEAPPTGRRYRDRQTLPSFIVSIMSDGIGRDLDEIEKVVAETYPADQPPSRNTISTRLNEMVRAGKLDKTSSGIYRIKNP